MSLKLTLNPQMSSYYSSEIDEDSVRVVKIHHPEVVHLGDIRDITQQQVSIRIRALKKVTITLSIFPSPNSNKVV